MGWSREVLPVLQQPLCNLPVLAVATMLDVGAMWLYDRQLRRVIPAAKLRSLGRMENGMMLLGIHQCPGS